MINNKKVVVVLPAYNAAKTLKITYSEIDFNIVDDVILVDDLSHDNTVEVGKELIVLVLRDRIELVVVTASASHCQAEPHRCGCIDTIGNVFDGILFRDDSTLGVTTVIAIETGRDSLAERRRRQHIARDLIIGELIEGHVAVECIDDPVSPTPHVARSVILIATCVGVASGIEPKDCHAFTEVRRCE